MKYYIITNDEKCYKCEGTITLCKEVIPIDIHKEDNEFNTCINCGETITVPRLNELNMVKISKKQYELLYALFSKKR